MIHEKNVLVPLDSTRSVIFVAIIILVGDTAYAAAAAADDEMMKEGWTRWVLYYYDNY